MRACNYPYIKSVRFEERNWIVDKSLQGRLKNEFYLHLNARKYRGMKFYLRGNIGEECCSFEVVNHVLIVKTNQDMINKLRCVLLEFDNIYESH